LPEPGGDRENARAADAASMTEDEPSTAAGAGPTPAAGRRSSVRFVVVFLLLLGAFQLLFHGVLVESRAFEAYLRWNASASGWLMNLYGAGVQVSGAAISSARGAIRIGVGCDAIQPCSVFAAAVLAFPGRWGARLVGLTAGLALLLSVNLLRIASLFHLKLDAPSAFSVAHTQVWPGVFVFLALLLWILWARTAGKP